MVPVSPVTVEPGETEGTCVRGWDDTDDGDTHVTSTGRRPERRKETSLLLPSEETRSFNVFRGFRVNLKYPTVI